MKRVCAPGGKLVVIDAAISPDPAKAAAYNRAEKFRDPSHTRALSLAEFELLFKWVGLPAPRKTFYKVEADLEDSLHARSLILAMLTNYDRCLLSRLIMMAWVSVRTGKMEIFILPIRLRCWWRKSRCPLRSWYECLFNCQVYNFLPCRW